MRHTESDIDDHDGGFVQDLKVMATLVERRRALQWFAGAGSAALVAGCGGGSESDATTVVTGMAATATATPTPTPTPTATSTTAATGTCIADPTETAGPYPADGTNSSSGSTSNALTASGIIRSDIRSSFIGSTTVAAGVKTVLTITVVDVNALCAPLAGYAVYLWHCDRNGDYSLYTVASESYLRGVQVTDANGQVRFTTIFPGAYAGRYPHMHFEVFSSLAAATGGRYAVLTSQLAMPSAACSAVYADAITYPNSATRFAQTPVSSDGIFSDSSTAQIAQQTPDLSGSPSAGYTGNVIVGVPR